MNSLNVKHQGISSNQLAFQAFMKTLKSNISEVYKLQADSDSYDKNDMKKKVNDLVRLHRAMQEKLKNSIIFRTNPKFYLDTSQMVSNVLFRIF